MGTSLNEMIEVIIRVNMPAEIYLAFENYFKLNETFPNSCHWTEGFATTFEALLLSEGAGLVEAGFHVGVTK